METLVAVDQHRNQFHSRVKRYGHARFGASPPSKQFREINCRTFQSGAGFRPTPTKVCPGPVSRRSPPPVGKLSSPKTPSPASKANVSSPCGYDLCRVTSKVTKKDVSLDRDLAVRDENGPAIVGGVVMKKEMALDRELTVDKNVLFSELWAGPAYSNSPPPSSLPMPKFWMRPKRTVSLNLPVTDSGLEMPPTAKSAPASPTRGRKSPMSDLFSTDSATQTLRRILNLDLADE